MLRNKLTSVYHKRNLKVFFKLHFCNNDDAQDRHGDKFFRIYILLKSFNKSYLKYGPSTDYFSVDQCIVPYFGRHSSKLFIRGKPIRFGFKAWVL